LRLDIKVLFVTGYAQNAAIAAGHLDAGLHVMTKPFSMTALASKVREILDE
jgi:DNA-binding response OmpR family regulator